MNTRGPICCVCGVESWGVRTYCLHPGIGWKICATCEAIQAPDGKVCGKEVRELMTGMVSTEDLPKFEEICLKYRLLLKS